MNRETEVMNPRESMSNPERLSPKDLVVGGRSLHVNRFFIRQFDSIEADTVVYHDHPFTV